MKNLTVGKRLGLISFYIYEAIIILLSIYVGINFFFGSKTLDSNVVNAILLGQANVFTIVWGAKSVANFAKKSTEETGQ
jgi:hypothetical protein